MEPFFIKTAQLILSLSILVFVHEFGHAFFSRIFRVKVEKFYLFFNPWFSLFKYKSKKSGTEYGIGWLPLGGYAKIAGMIDESLDNDFLKQTSQSWEYRSKPVWNRILISIGGVLMNFILAFFIYSMIAFKWGDHYIPMDKTPLFFGKLAHQAGFQDQDILLEADGKPLTRYDDLDLFRVIDAHQVTVLRKGKKEQIIFPHYFKSQFIASKTIFADFQLAVIDSLLSGSNAEKAGLKKGDKIISVAGEKTCLFGELLSLLSKKRNMKVQLTVEREGGKMDFQVQVDTKGKIGFISASQGLPVYVHYHFIKAFSAGLILGVRKLSFYFLQLKLFFTKIGMENMGGFGTIGRLFPFVWDWLTFWNMTAFLSIMLGVMNTLPIPALDGGHVVFLLYEAVSGRKPNEKVMEYAQIAGMIFLLALLIYANGMDIVRAFFK